MSRVQQLEDRLAALEHRLANMMPVGRVIARDHDKGIKIELGTDEYPCPSDWFQPGDRTGAGRYLPEMGEQVMMLCPGGDWRQAGSVPLTHSDAKKNPARDADETVHHNRDGQRHSVRKGHVKDKADKKHSRFVGDEPKGGSSAKPAHELQRQLQGIRASLTQHDQQIGGLHDATSKFRDIVQKFIPPVMAVEHLLKGDPQSLDKAAQGIAGRLEGYVAKTLQNAVGKLAQDFMGNALGLVQGFMQGQIGDVLGQVEALAGQAGLSAQAAAPLAAARAAVGAAAGGSSGAGPMGAAMGALGAVFAGSPAEAAFGLLRGQMGGLLGMAADVAGGLGDLVDNQKNLTRGLTKHYRLGGYDGEDD